MSTLQPDVVSFPAPAPIMTFSLPLALDDPVKHPSIILLSPAFNSQAAALPIAILKQVSESDAAPALVPAYKFSCESAENPPSELPSALAKFDAVMTPLTHASPATLNLELGFVVPIPTIKSQVPEIQFV